MNTTFRVLAALVALLLGDAAANAQFLGMPRYYLGPHARGPYSHPLVGPRSLRPLRYTVPLAEVRETRSTVQTPRSKAAERAGPEQVGGPLEDVAPLKLIDVAGERNTQIAKALAEARAWSSGVKTIQSLTGLRAAVRDPVVLRVGKDPEQRRAPKSDADVLPRSAVQWAPLPDGLHEVYRDTNRAVLIVAGEKAGKYTVYAVVLRAASADAKLDAEPLLAPKKIEPKKTEPKSKDAKPTSKKEFPKTEADKTEPAPAGAMPLVAEDIVEFVPFVIEVGAAPADVVTPVTPIKPVKPDGAAAAPIAVDGFSVLFVAGKSIEDQLRMPHAQRSMLESAAVKEYLDRTCVKINGQPAWRYFDPRATVTDEPWKAAMARPRGAAPWLIISNGQTGYEGPLPGANAATTQQAIAELMELFRKYGG